MDDPEERDLVWVVWDLLATQVAADLDCWRDGLRVFGAQQQTDQLLQVQTDCEDPSEQPWPVPLVVLVLELGPQP